MASPVSNSRSISDEPGQVERPPYRQAIKKTWLARSRAWVSIGLLTPIGFLAAFSVTRVPPGGWLEFTLEVVGWLLFLSGATFRWWATLFIGGRKGNQLASSGPYSITRNPLYFGTFLMLMSVAVFVHSLSLGVTSLLVGFYYLGVTIPGEERRLANVHGQEYAEYCKRVPRFFPRPALIESPELIEVKVQGLRAEFIRSTRWAGIPILCHAYLLLHVQPWWPHWFAMP